MGEKATLLDGRLTLNSAAYFEQWRGVQKNIPLPCGYPYTDNSVDAHIYGSEIELTGLIATGLILVEAEPDALLRATMVFNLAKQSVAQPALLIDCRQQSHSRCRCLIGQRRASRHDSPKIEQLTCTLEVLLTESSRR